MNSLKALFSRSPARLFACLLAVDVETATIPVDMIVFV